MNAQHNVYTHEIKPAFQLSMTTIFFIYDENMSMVSTFYGGV